MGGGGRMGLFTQGPLNSQNPLVKQNGLLGTPTFQENSLPKYPSIRAGVLNPTRNFTYWGHTVRCAKSRLFSTTGSYGSQGPEFCTLQPLLVHQGFFFLL